MIMPRYKIIYLGNFIIFTIFALITIPYFENDWSDGYFSTIRTIILVLQYVFHTSFFYFDAYLLKKKKVLLAIISVCIQIQ